MLWIVLMLDDLQKVVSFPHRRLGLAQSESLIVLESILTHLRIFSDRCYRG